VAVKISSQVSVTEALGGVTAIPVMPAVAVAVSEPRAALAFTPLLAKTGEYGQPVCPGPATYPLS